MSSLTRKELVYISIILLSATCTLQAQATEYRAADVAAEVKLLSSQDDGVRKSAAYHLSEMGVDAKDALPRMIEVLNNDPSPGVRGEISSALGKMGPAAEPAIPALIAFLSSEDGGYERTYAASALGSIGKRPDIALPALGGALDNDIEPVVRQLAARAMSDFGADARPQLPLLIKTIKEGDKDLRTAACYAVERIPASKEVVPSLTELLSDEIDSVRAAAAKSLGGAGSDAASTVPKLIKLVTDQNSDVRTAAVLALGQIGPDAREALPTLKEALKDAFLKGDATNSIEAIKRKTNAPEKPAGRQRSGN